MSQWRDGEECMSLSWFSQLSLKVSPKVRLVDDGESEALRRKLESVDWKPANGFIKDQPIAKKRIAGGRNPRAA